MAKPGYWLLKTEPGDYSIDDLLRDGRTCWDGVRNYQARNYLRDQLQVGDLALIYHSSAEPTGVAGVARVCRTAYPDHTAWDKKSNHFDAKSKKEAPTWYMVDVEFVVKFTRVVTLEEMKKEKRLSGMMVIQRGQRPSVQPVDAAHYKIVTGMAKGK